MKPTKAAPPVSDSDTGDKISEKSSSSSLSSSIKEEKDEKSESSIDEECKGKDEFVIINDYHFRTLSQSVDSGGEIKVFTIILLYQLLYYDISMK